MTEDEKKIKRNLRQKRWREKNKEKIKLYHKKWSDKNREKIKAVRKKHRSNEDNYRKHLEYNKKYLSKYNQLDDIKNKKNKWAKSA